MLKPSTKWTRGSITIEGAIILPIIIMMFLIFFSLMQMVYIHGRVQVELNNICKEFSYDSYLLETVNLFDKVQDVYGRDDTRYSVDELMALSSEDLYNPIESIDWSINRPLDLISTGSDVLNAVDESMVGLSLIGNTLRKEGVYYVSNRIGRSYFENKLQILSNDLNLNGDIKVEHLELFLEEDYGVIIVSYPRKLPINILGVDELVLKNSSSIQIFSGCGDYITQHNGAVETSSYGKGKKESKTEDEDGHSSKVYVTSHGEKYHKNPSCWHIRVKPVPVTFDSIGSLPACSKCGGDMPLASNAIVYKTNYGDVYHTSLTCNAIYHNLKSMTEKEAIGRGLSPCNTCSRGE